ncbi:MAG TPA: flagellar basal body-associated FliL family protein [Candidatus Acidoferrum sp.]|nr:flagellar basal body-associated FliL family protein [Candidatus Acidoferrum sp.]
MSNRTNIALEESSEVANGAAASAGGGGFKAFLPLIITVVLMPALAWTMTTFVLVPRLQKSLGVAPAASDHADSGHEAAATEGGHGETKDKGAAKETVTMTKLLVNVSGTMGSRYLLTSVTMAGNSADFRTKMEKNEAKLRDTACTLLATKTINDLEKPGARNLVRSELLVSFNNILGANAVQEIYITEFAIQ